jgi:L-histidine Nalpha-methyltransferase / hercynylcysteine S-oxide synthase
VNSHLINDGVEESPPSSEKVNGFSSTTANPSPSAFFTNLEGANVGFMHWHPVPITPNGNELSGQAELGGVWEWTSTVLEKHEGFEPMELYPGYTGTKFYIKNFGP